MAGGESTSIDYESANHGWNTALQSAAYNVGNLLSGNGEALSTLCRVELIKGDQFYTAVPNLYREDSLIIMKCNLDAYDAWIDVLHEVPSIERRQIQQLYLGTAAAWAELSLTADKAKHDRESRTNSRERSSAMKRATVIYKKFYERKDFFEHADHLEQEHGIIGVQDTILKLTDEQVVEVNRVRYGLGVSLLAFEADAAVAAAVPDAFARNLRAELSLREDTLIQFIDAFSRTDRYADIAGNYDKIKKHSFPEFLFAGTIPMDISDIL